MLPENLHDLLLASVGASASFIGLLFVALTVVMGRGGNDGAVTVRDRVYAESSYTALITILFISFVGLIPDASLSWIFLIFGTLGALQSIRMAVGVKRDTEDPGELRIRPGLASMYVLITAYGLYLVARHGALLDLGIFYTIIFTLYGVALGRAWALTGLDEHRNARQPR